MYNSVEYTTYNVDYATRRNKDLFTRYLIVTGNLDRNNSLYGID